MDGWAVEGDENNPPLAIPNASAIAAAPMIFMDSSDFEGFNVARGELFPKTGTSPTRVAAMPSNIRGRNGLGHQAGRTPASLRVLPKVPACRPPEASLRSEVGESCGTA